MLKKIGALVLLGLFCSQLSANFDNLKKLINAQTKKPLVAGFSAQNKQFNSTPITIKCADGNLSLINNPENRLRSRSVIERSHLKNLYIHSKNGQQALKNGQFDFSALSKKQVLLALKYAGPRINGEKNLAKLDAQTLYELSSTVGYLQTDIVSQEKIGELFAEKILKKIGSKERSGQELIGMIKNTEIESKFENGLKQRLTQEAIEYPIEKLESMPIIKGIKKLLTLKISPQANYLMTSEPHGNGLNVYNMATGEKKKFGGMFGATNKTGVFSYDEKYFAAPTSHKVITIFEVQGSDFKPLHTITSASTVGSCKLLFSKANQLLIHGNNVKIFDLKTQSEVEIPLASSVDKYSFDFTDNGQYLSVDSYAGDSFIWDLKNSNYAKDLRGGEFKGITVYRRIDHYKAVRLSPHGDKYILYHRDGKVTYVLDFVTDETITAHNGIMKFDADGKAVNCEGWKSKLIKNNFFVSQPHGGVIKIFDKSANAKRELLSANNRMAISKDKSAMVYQYENGDIHLVKFFDRIPQNLKTHEILQVIRNEKLKPGVGGSATLAYFLEQKNKQQNANNNHNGKEEEQK